MKPTPTGCRLGIDAHGYWNSRSAESTGETSRSRRIRPWRSMCGRYQMLASGISRDMPLKFCEIRHHLRRQRCDEQRFGDKWKGERLQCSDLPGHAFSDGEGSRLLHHFYHPHQMGRLIWSNRPVALKFRAAFLPL